MDPIHNVSNSSLEAAAGDYRVLQPLWNFFLAHEYHVSSPLFPVIFSVAFYFLSILPWMVCDLWGKDWWIQKYKIQKDKDVTYAQVWRAVVLTFWNHVLYILPLSTAQWVYVPAVVLPRMAPSLWEVTWQLLACLAIFDLEYFLWHSLHHKVRWLYRHVHAVHHQYSSPSSWVTQYLHPWELISVGVFSTTSPWIIGSHPLTELFFQIFAIVASVDAHIGYDLTFMPHTHIPLYGGTKHHDMHHQKPLTNFAPFYTFWDHVFGTYCPGQEAGGSKSKALMSWEKSDKQKKFMARQAKLESKETMKQKMC